MSGETKISEMAAQIQQRLPINRSSMTRAFEWYHSTYFKTNSHKPIIHVMLLVGALGYALEYPHLKHEIQHARKEATEI